MALDFKDTIEHLYELKVRKSDKDAELKEINKEIDAIEFKLIEMMDEQGLDKVKSLHGTASLKVEMYPQIKDMESFVRWCADNGKADMLQKRVSKGSFDEFYKDTAEYPEGVDTYTKKSINFRKAK